MKAGMDFKKNEDQKQTPPKPKGRRGMPVIDPKKGFPVSEEAAKALIANGATDARPKQSAVVPETSINKSAADIAPSTGVIASHQSTSYPSTQTQAASVPTVCKALLQARILLKFSSFSGMKTRSAHQTAQSADQAAIRRMIRKIPATVRKPSVSQSQPIPPLYLVKLLLPPAKSASPLRRRPQPRSAPGSVSTRQQMANNILLVQIRPVPTASNVSDSNFSSILQSDDPGHLLQTCSN